MELKSERIILRPLSCEDAPAILDYRADPECYRFQTWQPETLADVEQFIAQRIVAEPDVPGTWFQLAICRRESGEVMGDCGIHFLADEPRQVEIGITLRRECQGMGYASETLHLVFTYVFGSLGKHRVIASVDPDNHASLRLLERMGMRREAHFVESLWCKDHWADDVVYALLAREWQARWLIEPVIEGGKLMGTARDIALVFLCLEAFVAALVPLAILGGLIYGLAWLTRQARQGLQIAQDYARLAHVYVERASQAVAEPFIRANELALMFMTITQRLFQSFGRR